MVSGTLRTFTETQREEAFARLRALCAGIGDTHEVTVTLEVPERTPAVVNDVSVTDLVEARAQSVLGSDKVFRMPPASPSDDVSEFLNHLPGCYFFVGGGGDRRLERHAPQPHLLGGGRAHCGWGRTSSCAARSRWPPHDRPTMMGR